MFANTQMMGFGVAGLSPLRAIGQMAHSTMDGRTLLVLQAGLHAMLAEAKKAGVLNHDHATAETDLQYLESRTGRKIGLRA